MELALILLIILVTGSLFLTLYFVCEDKTIPAVIFCALCIQLLNCITLLVPPTEGMTVYRRYTVIDNEVLAILDLIEYNRTTGDVEVKGELKYLQEVYTESQRSGLKVDEIIQRRKGTKDE